MGEVFIQCEMQSYKLVSLGKHLPYCVKGSALGAVCMFSRLILTAPWGVTCSHVSKSRLESESLIMLLK